MSRILKIAVATALLAGAANAAPAAPADGSALARIDRAFVEGRIDAPTHALLGLRLVRFPETLPAAFRPAPGESRLRCGTLLARRAFLLAREGAFDEAQRAEFAVLGGRPSLPNSLPVMNGGSLVATVHYDSAAVTNAPEIVAFLAESWAAEFDTMGWRVPPPDVGAGGADPGVELDLYLQPGQFGAYTQPIQEDTCPDAWACTASYIVLEPAILNVETYVAHELNHSSQFAYDYSDGDFVYEATATWMEDKVYDAVDDYEFFIADFQQAPDKTLSFATYNDNYMYGGAVFFHYLADLYDAGGTTLVRDVWDGLKNNQDWYDGVESALASDGFTDIADVYREFAGVRMLTGSRDDGTIEEGGNMTSITIEGTSTVGSLEGGESDDPPMGMGANYVTVATAGAEVGESLTIHVSSSEPGPWAITTVGMPATGAATITVFLDEDDDGRVEATVPDVSAFNQVGFAITNTANSTEGADSSFGSGVDKTVHPFSWNYGGGGGSDPAGCGCSIPGGRRSPNAVSVIAAFLLAALTIVLRRR